MNIICFSDISWDLLWQRHQQLLTRLPSSWKILFLEPMSFRGLKEKPTSIFPRRMRNFILISLPIIPPFEKHRITRKIDDLLVFLYIRIFTCIFNIKRPVLLFYEPRFSSLIGFFNECLVWYEYIDNKLGFSWVAGWMKYYDDLLMTKADIITASSKSLYENARRRGARNVHLVGNAVDMQHFKNVPAIIQKDLKDLKRPVIGYAGAISDWFDFELIEKAAVRFPDVTFLFVGPIQPEMIYKSSILKKKDNIIFTGKKRYDELPLYISQFDVAIIPFKINALTSYVNPIKLYEYLAAGKPVVSSALPDIDEFKDIIYIANDHEEFMQSIKNALENEHKFDKYIDIIRNNNWDKRAEQVTDLINKYSIEEK